MLILILIGLVCLMTQMSMVWYLVCGVLGALCMVSIGQVLYYRFRLPSAKTVRTPYIKRYMRRVRRATGTKPDVKWEFVPIHQIPDFLVTLADIGESLSSHMCHHGFTWFGYYLAYLNNRRGLLLRGYSNISQQTAKNLFIPFRRKMWRKLLEAYYTILIELLWGKKRIMEYYLNIAEFGPGIYGCQAGCQHYFGHGIDQLTLDEGFMLIATLLGPCMHSPFNQTDYWNKVKGDIVSRYNPLCQTDLDHRPVGYSSRQEYAMQWSFAQFVVAVVFNELLILIKKIYGNKKRKYFKI